MQELYLPNRIKRYVQNMQYHENKVGCSQAGIYRFFSSSYVLYLKVEPKSGELEKEYKNIEWLQGKLPVPKIIEWFADDNFDYLLLSEVSGNMLCDECYMKNPFLAVETLAKGLKLLQTIDITTCHINNCLEIKLRDANDNIIKSMVDMDDWEDSNRFSTPKELLEFLINNKPANEELVFTHGDYCLPNVLGMNNQITGFIDMGRAGIADVWQDVALCIRSLWHNFHTKDYDGLLLEKIGIPLDSEKLDYYILLDELF